MFTPEKIQELIRAAIPDAQTKVVDQGGDNYHVELVVVANAFEGKNPVQRHRMVYAALGNIVGYEIHALTVKAYTPAEAAKL